MSEDLGLEPGQPNAESIEVGVQIGGRGVGSEVMTG